MNRRINFIRLLNKRKFKAFQPSFWMFVCLLKNHKNLSNDKESSKKSLKLLRNFSIGNDRKPRHKNFVQKKEKKISSPKSFLIHIQLQILMTKDFLILICWLWLFCTFRSSPTIFHDLFFLLFFYVLFLIIILHSSYMMRKYMIFRLNYYEILSIIYNPKSKRNV